jgi:hypothetical protein
LELQLRSRKIIALWIAVGVLAAVGLWDLYAMSTESCEEAQSAEANQCTAYHVALGLWLHIRKFFDDHEEAFTAFFIIVLFGLTILVWYSAHKLEIRARDRRGVGKGR